MKIGDKSISLTDAQQHLIQSPWVNDCYIARHPEQPGFAAWVELNEEGIQAFRDNGRQNVIEQLKTHFTKTQESVPVPCFWRFTDKLPRNGQPEISELEFARICTAEIVDPLWTSQEIQENSHIFHGKIPLDLRFFNGHFAHFPLVPGVVELQWVIDQMHICFPRTADIVRIDNLKFQKFLRPNDKITLILKREEHKHRIGFQLKTSGEMCGSGFIVLQNE